MRGAREVCHEYILELHGRMEESVLVGHAGKCPLQQESIAVIRSSGKYRWKRCCTWWGRQCELSVKIGGTTRITSSYDMYRMRFFMRRLMQMKYAADAAHGSRASSGEGHSPAWSTGKAVPAKELRQFGNGGRENNENLRRTSGKRASCTTDGCGWDPWSDQ